MALLTAMTRVLCSAEVGAATSCREDQKESADNPCEQKSRMMRMQGNVCNNAKARGGV